MEKSVAHPFRIHTPYKRCATAFRLFILNPIVWNMYYWFAIVDFR